MGGYIERKKRREGKWMQFLWLKRKRCSKGFLERNFTWDEFNWRPIKKSQHIKLLITCYYMNKLEHLQNQALTRITGAVKIISIDAMLAATGNLPIQNLIKERAIGLLLQKKLLRIPEDQFWINCWNITRKLIMQYDLLQKSNGA